MPDFDAAQIEFTAQVDVLKSLVNLVEATAAGQMSANEELLKLPLVPPLGKNTMSSAAIVLLAAHFEEYIRQQIQAYATAYAMDIEFLNEHELETLQDCYWRGATNKLSRIRPKGDPRWLPVAENQLRSLIAYPVEGRLENFLAPFLSEHENNMRWDTITELTGRLGIKKLGDQLFDDADLRNEIGVDKKGDFSRAVSLRLNEFYTLRNGIVHSIAQNSGIGATIVMQWSAVLSLFANAFADVLKVSRTNFDAEIVLRKEKRERRARAHG